MYFDTILVAPLLEMMGQQAPLCGKTKSRIYTYIFHYVKVHQHYQHIPNVKIERGKVDDRH